MTKDELDNAWGHLWDWWALHGGRYNVPYLAREMGLQKGRLYAALKPGSQGGSTVRYTEELYLIISKHLSQHYRRPVSLSVIPPKEELERLYLEKGMTQEEIGKRYNRHGVTARDWLLRYNIPIRPNGRVSTSGLTGENILDAVDQGLKQGLTLFEFCKLHRTIASTVQKILEAGEHPQWKDLSASWRKKIWLEIRAAIQDQPERLQLVRQELGNNATSFYRALRGDALPNHGRIWQIAHKLTALGFTSEHFLPRTDHVQNP